MARDSAGNNAEVDASGDAPASGHFEDSKWHMFVGTVDRTADLLYMYIDGVLKGSTSTSSLVSITNTSQRLEIGCQNTGGTPANPADTGTFSLFRFSLTHINDTQIRQMYDAEKGMFVASAECLLQSGTTDAVIDVDVDPLTGKVLVTQTDAITIFDGLVVDSKPTVNSGASEKGKLWGDLRAEQNSANAYVTAPAVDQRQVNEMVRGLASDLPAGVDLGKAKAWFLYDGGSNVIKASYNVKSIANVGTGDFEITWGIPFKSDEYVLVGSAEYQGDISFRNHTGRALGYQSAIGCSIQVYQSSSSNSTAYSYDHCYVVAYGELENE
jgi:hypothetical protein